MMQHYKHQITAVLISPVSSHFFSPALRIAFLLLLLISATWLLGLMAVNSNVMIFHYLFAIFSCLQVTEYFLNFGSGWSH